MTRSIAALAVCCLFSCDRAPAEGPPPKDVVARVNGRPVTAFDVAMSLKSPFKAALKKQSPEEQKASLEQVIEAELFAQRAVELGLDRDPAYLEELARIEAQARAARRTALARYFRTHEVLEKATVTDADLKAYFEAHREALTKELHLQQAIFTSRAAADAALAAIAQGQAFEVAVAPAFPGTTPEQKPWDMGFLTIDLAPAFARAELLKLAPGQVSPPIEVSGAFWVYKLVEVRTNSAITAEAVAPRLQATLKAEQFAKRLSAVQAEVRAKAKIDYVTPPTPAPEPQAPPAPENE